MKKYLYIILLTLLVIQFFDIYSEYNNYIFIICSLLIVLLFIHTVYVNKYYDIKFIAEYKDNLTTKLARYSEFLDVINSNTKDDEFTRIDYYISEISNKFCPTCHKKVHCNKHNSKKKNEYIVNVFTNNKSREKEFYLFCPHTESINNYIYKIKTQINLLDKKEYRLINQVSYLTNFLNNFIVDFNEYTDLGYLKLYSLKKSLNSKFGLKNVSILEYKNDYFELEIIENKINMKKIILHCQKFINQEVSVVQVDTNVFKIIPRVKTKANYGRAKLSKKGNEVNGDNYLVRNSNSRFITCLSDGMGTGYNAYTQSNKILNLVNRFIDLNIDIYTQIDLLNTYYSIKDSFENYATLDLLIVDNIKQVATFLKVGSSNSIVIYNNNSYKIISNKNLPLGIQEKVEEYTLDIIDVSLIITMSDGIFEQVEEDELISFIKLISNKNEQRIAYDIISYVSEHGKQSDDMSTIVVKIQSLMD